MPGRKGRRLAPGRETGVSGFSLLETVVVLFLVGMLTAGGGAFLASLSNAYVDSVGATEMAGKTQAAMSRILIELTTITDVSSGNGSSITYQSRDGGGGLNWHTLEWSGTGHPLTLDGATLLDGVDNLSMAYISIDGNGNETRSSAWTSQSRCVEVSVTPNGPGGRSYTVAVYCRNLAG